MFLLSSNPSPSQRFQAVNNATPSHAGVQLPTLTLTTLVFSFLAGALMPHRKPPVEYIILIAASLTAIGIGLVSCLPTGMMTLTAIYGYEVILGAGLAAVMPASYFLLKIHVPEEDIASATGVSNTARTISGCISFFIRTGLLHNSTDTRLAHILTPDQLAAIKESLANIESLSTEETREVRETFGNAYHRQFRVLVAFALCNVLVAGLLVLAVHKKARRKEKEIRQQGEQGDGVAHVHAHSQIELADQKELIKRIDMEDRLE